MNKISKFLRGVSGELAYVDWPTRQEAIAYTFIVIVVSLLIAGYMGLLDTIFLEVIKPILN